MTLAPGYGDGFIEISSEFGVIDCMSGETADSHLSSC